MASRKEGSGAAGGGFGASKGKGKAAATGDSAVKQVQIDGLVSGGAGAAAGGGMRAEGPGLVEPPAATAPSVGPRPSRGRCPSRGAGAVRIILLPGFPPCGRAHVVNGGLMAVESSLSPFGSAALVPGCSAPALPFVAQAVDSRRGVRDGGHGGFPPHLRCFLPALLGLPAPNVFSS